MAPRFTVIQGGLSVRPGRVAERPTEREPNRIAAWRVDLHRPASPDTESVSAWRAMLARNAATDPLSDPDPLPPLAQQRSADRQVTLAMVWDRDAEPERAALRSVGSMAVPAPVWDRRARPWQPPDAGAIARMEQAAAEVVDRALRARLGAARRPIRLVGAVEPVRVVPRIRLAPMADRSAYPRSIPATSLIGIRPVGWEASAFEIPSITEAHSVRDAVETIRTVDAHTAQRPIIAVPAEASLGRVVSRLFERRGALRDAVLRRAGAIGSRTRFLGSAAGSAPWRRARA